VNVGDCAPHETTKIHRAPIDDVEQNWTKRELTCQNWPVRLQAWIESGIPSQRKGALTWQSCAPFVFLLPVVDGHLIFLWRWLFQDCVIPCFIPSATAIWCDSPRKHFRFPFMTAYTSAGLNPFRLAQFATETPLSRNHACTCAGDIKSCCTCSQ
jgi:hypothetical protein